MKEDIAIAARRLRIQSRSAQGLPERLEDPVVIDQIAILFRSAHVHPRRDRQADRQVA